jgi:hypothetical protein
MYSSSTVLPYFYSTMSLFSGSVQGVPKTPVWKCINKTSPSFEHASRMFPLNPQLRSVTPKLKLSIIIVSGF